MNTTSTRNARSVGRIMRFVLWLLPHQDVTLTSPLDVETAHQRLTEVFNPPMVVPAANFFDSERSYVAVVEGNRIQVRGPFGEKLWRLHTEGMLAPATEGSTLRLALRLDDTHAMLALVLLGLCALFGIVGGDWPSLLVMLVPVLCIYLGIAYVFYREARRIKAVLNRLLASR